MSTTKLIMTSLALADAFAAAVNKLPTPASAQGSSKEKCYRVALKGLKSGNSPDHGNVGRSMEHMPTPAAQQPPQALMICDAA